MAEQSQDVLAEQINKALDDSSIPTIYFNGFINSLGSGDVLLILTRTGQPVVKLHASYTVAKTLAVKLGIMIAGLESDSGNVIMTTDDVNRAVESRKRGEDDASAE